MVAYRRWSGHVVTPESSSAKPTGSTVTGGSSPTGWESALRESERVTAWASQHLARLDEAAALLVDTLRNGGVVFACGNGGSALQAQHLAAELVGRFRRERRPLPSLALTADSGAVTGIANDYGYEEVFARQVAGLGKSGDLLVLLSTSGASVNILRACGAARERGMRTVALTREGGPLAASADLALAVPSENTARIQECHLLLIHLLCERIDAEFGPS